MDFRDKPQFPKHYELVESHIEKHFKDAEMNVFHEITTLDIHLDVYHIKPKDVEYEILLTAGMSSIAMNVSEIPENAATYQFAELVVIIRAGLDFGKMFPSKTENDWIISMIKQVGKFPHFYDTWIGIGHTIQAHEELVPYDEHSDFCGCMVLPTVSFPDEFSKIESPDGVINIYGLFPMYKEEMEYKIENGYNSFLQFLINNNTPEGIDIERENFCG